MAAHPLARLKHAVKTVLVMVGFILGTVPTALARPCAEMDWSEAHNSAMMAIQSTMTDAHLHAFCNHVRSVVNAKDGFYPG